jgi:hypothetical protein
VGLTHLKYELEGGVDMNESTDDEREALVEILVERSNGGYLAPVHPRQADAILAAGFRRQGPISDAMVLAAVDAFMRSQSESEDGPSLVHKNIAAALEAAAAAADRSE